MYQHKIVIERAGTVGNSERHSNHKDWLLLTYGDTRYLKRRYLRRLLGFKEVADCNCMWVSKQAISEGHYGDTFYAIQGTVPFNWKKLYIIKIVKRILAGLPFNLIREKEELT